MVVLLSVVLYIAYILFLKNEGFTAITDAATDKADVATKSAALATARTTAATSAAAVITKKKDYDAKSNAFDYSGTPTEGAAAAAAYDLYKAALATAQTDNTALVTAFSNYQAACSKYALTASIVASNSKYEASAKEKALLDATADKAIKDRAAKDAVTAAARAATLFTTATNVWNAAKAITDAATTANPATTAQIKATSDAFISKETARIDKESADALVVSTAAAFTTANGLIPGLTSEASDASKLAASDKIESDYAKAQDDAAKKSTLTTTVPINTSPTDSTTDSTTTSTTTSSIDSSNTSLLKSSPDFFSSVSGGFIGAALGGAFGKMVSGNQWTRGGDGPSRRYNSDQWGYNEGDPDSIRWPNSNYDSSNLHSVGCDDEESC